MATAPLTPWSEPTTAEAFLWGIYNNIEGISVLYQHLIIFIEVFHV